MDEHNVAILNSLLGELDRPEDKEIAPAPVTVSPAEESVLHDSQGDEVIEMGIDFDLNGFQVVRREFFAHLHEPSITFHAGKFGVNSACLNRFPDADFVEVLVNKETKVLALRPCTTRERDSFQWCTKPKGKRTPRQITCKIFSAMIISLMGWNHKNRYKLLGRVIRANGEYLIAFDLNATEVYLSSSKEGEKPKNSRTPVFPEEWEGQFGMPYQEHRKYLQISIFDGYAAYMISDKDNRQNQAGEIPSEEPVAVSANLPGGDT